jgi:hypothetical protein
MKQLLAPNGKPSNLTPEQWRLVRTPQFKAWFGDWENEPENASKVVDENGEPLVVYHSTNNLYNEFSYDKASKGDGAYGSIGFYFTAYKQYKSSSAYGKIIKKCFLNLRNPMKVAEGFYEYEATKHLSKLQIIKIIRDSDKKNTNEKEFVDWVSRTLNKTNENQEKIKYHLPIELQLKLIWQDYYFNIMDNNQGKNIEAFQKSVIKNTKFDGSYIVNANYYVAFLNNQIKLADGTNTTFDGSNPDIRFAKGGTMNKQLLAPNGKPSNLTPEQWKLVRTPQFKAWFGDWENDPENASKVVDENDEPLVVYHGTNSEFYNFDKNSESNTHGTSQGFQGFFFTKSKGRSGDYALSKEELKGGDAIVISAFLSLKNPNIKDAKNQSWVNVYPEQIDDSFDNGNDGVITYNILDGATSYSYWNNNPDDNYIVFHPNQIKLADGTNITFDGSNPDIRFAEGGKVEKLIDQGIVDLKIYDTTTEHSKLYGFECFKPLYIQRIFINENERTNGIGADVLKYIDEYAKENKHDLIFGHIQQKAEPSVDAIKTMLRKNGYSTIEGNNDFYKYIDHNTRFAKNGEVNSNSFMKWFVQWYKPISNKVNIAFSFSNHLQPFKEKSVIILDVFEKIDQNIDAKPYLQEIVKKADEYGVVIYLEPKPRHKVGYYEKFGFELTPNKLFMKRKPSNSNIRFAEGGTMKNQLLAPNRKPSNLTPEQWKLVRTPQFKAWFGDWENDPENASKVVDENGEPLVVYHGTSYDFNVFKIGRMGGLFFTDNLSYAERFASGDMKRQGEKSKMLKCFLNARKCYDKNTHDETLIDDYYNKFVEEGATKLKKKERLKYVKSLEDKYKDFFINLAGFSMLDSNRKNHLLLHNYDCIITDGYSDTKFYVVFESKQIKLADGTNTTFDGSNPDIRFAEGGKTKRNMKKIKRGGITYGKSHAEGGIPVKNQSTGDMLEVEGGEGIVNKRSMASKSIVTLNGKKMNICQAVSELNQMEGGVKFSCEDVNDRQFIKAMAKGGELERGVRTEQEHIQVLKDLYAKRITPKQASERIAKDHLKEDSRYYSKLAKMEGKMADGGNIKDFQVGDIVTHKKGEQYGHGKIYKLSRVGFYLEDEYGVKSTKHQIFPFEFKKVKRLADGGKIIFTTEKIKGLDYEEHFTENQFSQLNKILNSLKLEKIIVKREDGGYSKIYQVHWVKNTDDSHSVIKFNYPYDVEIYQTLANQIMSEVTPKFGTIGGKEFTKANEYKAFQIALKYWIQKELDLSNDWVTSGKNSVSIQPFDSYMKVPKSGGTTAGKYNTQIEIIPFEKGIIKLSDGGKTRKNAKITLTEAVGFDINSIDISKL